MNGVGGWSRLLRLARLLKTCGHPEPARTAMVIALDVLGWRWRVVYLPDVEATHFAVPGFWLDRRNGQRIEA